MSARARIYVGVVLLLGGVLGGLSLAILVPTASQWLTCLALTALCSLSHLLKARGPNHEAWHANLVFLFAGVLLLPPPLFVLLVTIPHLIEWAKERLAKSPSLRSWYIQPFNIASHIIAGSAAHWVVVTIRPGTMTFPTLSSVVAIMAALLTYLALNHSLIAAALVLARGVSWRESGIFDTENVLSDLALLCLGCSVAKLWELSPWLILPAVAPLMPIYQALMVPQLKKEAQTDPKTGLLNARRFAQMFQAELERAERFGRPLSLIMADLDLLRNINNTYGHLAGDTVLAQMGQTIRDNIRAYDIAARFGGEEFVIVLPEARSEQARAFAERLRKLVERTDIPVRTSATPIRVTVSLGVASFPGDALTATTVIHEADVAVYQAKLRGRNCVVCASDVPHSIKLETSALRERLSAPYVAEFTPRP